MHYQPKFVRPRAALRQELQKERLVPFQEGHPTRQTHGEKAAFSVIGFPPNTVPGYIVQNAPNHAHPNATSKETGLLFKAIRTMGKLPKSRKMPKMKGRAKQSRLPRSGKSIVISSTIVTHPRKA